MAARKSRDLAASIWDSRLVLSMVSSAPSGFRVTPGANRESISPSGAREGGARSRLRAQEAADGLRHGGGLLQVRGVSRLLHRLHRGLRDVPRELLRVHRRHDAVLGAPDEERGRLHAVDALLEPFVGNGPDEFAGGAHGPRESHLRVDPRRLVVGLGEKHARGRSPGIAEDVSGHLVRAQHHPVGDGGIVAPETDGIDEHELARPARIGGGELAGDHRPEGMTHERRALEAEGVEKLVVAEDEVPQVVEMTDVVGSARGGARMLGRVHGELLGERIEERAPVQTPGTVEEEQGGPGALGQDAQADLARPHGDGAGVETVEIAHRAGRGAGSKRARSFSGHQWLTQPSFSHTGRSEGSTSRAKRSMFWRVSSWGMEPIWRRTMRLPTRRPLTTSSCKRSRTVAGLPEIT